MANLAISHDLCFGLSVGCARDARDGPRSFVPDEPSRLIDLDQNRGFCDPAYVVWAVTAWRQTDISHFAGATNRHRRASARYRDWADRYAPRAHRQRGGRHEVSVPEIEPRLVRLQCARTWWHGAQGGGVLTSLSPDLRRNVTLALVEQCFRLGPNGLDAGVFAAALGAGITLETTQPAAAAYRQRLDSNADLRLSLFPLFDGLRSLARPD
jgi:hypothetical protein